MGLVSPFDIPILQVDIEDGEDVAKELCEAAYSLRDQDPNGRLISHQFREYAQAEKPEDFEKHGYTSHGSFRLKEDQRFHRIHTATVKAMEQYLTHNECGHAFYLGNSWVSIYGNGSFAPEHTHPLCHLSCVFYGAATEGTGEIVFRNPAHDMYSQLYGNGVELFKDLYTIQPKVGQMIVFPAFMKHYTKPHFSDEDRVIFSCNATMDGALP